MHKWSSATALLGICLAACVAAAQSALLIRVQGDLDTTSIADEIDRVIADADARQKLEWVILEMHTSRARRDVVWMIARSLRDRGPKPIVLLKGEDARISLNVLALALCADHALIDKRTSLRSREGDNLEEFTDPDDQQRERHLRELDSLLWMTLTDRAIDTACADAILQRDDAELWIADNEGAPRLSPFPPLASATRIIGWTPSGSIEAHASAELLVSTGLLDDTARTHTEAFMSLGIRPRIQSRVTITSPIPGASKEAAALLRATSTAILDARDTIQRIRNPRGDRVVPVHEYHAAGRSMLSRVADARESIAELESLFHRVPELLRMPAPEGTRVARTEQRNTADWRRTILQHRDDLEYLERIAREYLAR